MDDIDLPDYICFTCGSVLKLDRGTHDDRVSPGTPRMVYCPDCDTEHPHVLVALDAETRERTRIRQGLLAEGTPDLDDAQDALDIISEALDRICPEEG